MLCWWRWKTQKNLSEFSLETSWFSGAGPGEKTPLCACRQWLCNNFYCQRREPELHLTFKPAGALLVHSDRTRNGENDQTPSRERSALHGQETFGQTGLEVSEGVTETWTLKWTPRLEVCKGRLLISCGGMWRSGFPVWFKCRKKDKEKTASRKMMVSTIVKEHFCIRVANSLKNCSDESWV